MSNVTDSIKNNSSKVLISIPDEFLKQIDAVAAIENRSRAELISEALRTYLNRNKTTKSQNRNAQILEGLFD